MKLVVFTTAYSAFIRALYSDDRSLHKKSYAEQKQALDDSAHGWIGVWPDALKHFGYEACDVVGNVEPLLRAWYQENGHHDWERVNLKTIAIEQLKSFKPDILWFDNHETEVLRAIKREVSSIKLVLGYTGSALPATDVWGDVDFVLSCAPEAVDKLRAMQVRTGHLRHAFNPKVLTRLIDRPKSIPVSFMGQVSGGSGFHSYREQILSSLVDAGIDIAVFSAAGNGRFHDLQDLVKLGLYDSTQALARAGLPGKIISKIPLLSKAANWPFPPARGVNRRIKKVMRPGVYGMNMFQTLRDCRLSLNVHADSSPAYASNMRLFETTGVGTCLLTDWKPNLPELFDPDREVVSYKSTEECASKLKWLLDHPGEADRIAIAGQKKCLADHTFTKRAAEVDEIVRRLI